MINIIKQGFIKPKTKTIYTITCDNCGCIFECENEDLEYRSRSLYTKHLTGVYHDIPEIIGGITCPTPKCNYKIEVTTDTPSREVEISNEE